MENVVDKAGDIVIEFEIFGGEPQSTAETSTTNLRSDRLLPDLLIDHDRSVND